MSQFAWPEQVATLSNMLNSLEAQMKGGDPGAAGLAEFKSALDDLRLPDMEPAQRIERG